MDRFSATADASLHIHPVTTTSLAFLVEILKDNETLVLIPRSLGHSLCAWGLACALDVTDVSALEGIGLLATPESLKHPAMQSMLDVLQQGVAAIA